MPCGHTTVSATALHDVCLLCKLSSTSKYTSQASIATISEYYLELSWTACLSSGNRYTGLLYNLWFQSVWVKGLLTEECGIPFGLGVTLEDLKCPSSMGSGFITLENLNFQRVWASSVRAWEQERVSGRQCLH